ncbi:MAG TPA: putative toxin-antitoxin system toxin component, PIN family, partial [Chloroflexota bacterium]|nr:putative toxin-antitoxin system toxin component, PIN family [Chloroflexota bacterium]
GLPYAIVLAWLARRFELVVSPALLSELREVLLRAKFRRYGSESDVEDFVGQFTDARLALDAPAERLVPNDPDDDYLMALARQVHAGYVVSGDRHLTNLHEPRPPVLRPRGFYELLESEAKRT